MAATKDSIYSASEIGSVHKTGTYNADKSKIYKTTFHSVETKPSIPSKYQTILVKEEVPKGFNSKDARFHTFSCMKPGPGSYEVGSVKRKNGVENASWSVAGTGGLASQSNRFQGFLGTYSVGPGPAKYSTPFAPGSIGSVKSGSTWKNTSSFSQPIAKPKTAPRKKGDGYVLGRKLRGSTLPGPASYNVSNKKAIVAVPATACFRSNNPREAFREHNRAARQVPGPGHYGGINGAKTVDGFDKVVYTQVDTKPTAQFTSQTDRFSHLFVVSDAPGPGQYESTKVAVDIRRPLRQHYLSLAGPAIPLPELPPPPGPGQYDIKSDIDIKTAVPDASQTPKTLDLSSRQNKTVSPLHSGGAFYGGKTSSFVSRVKREAYKTTNNPGPADYKVQPMKKMSFNYNAESKWI
eukprot:Nk52_evm30s2340 gene=Nk52_evmTU30s2340